MICAIYIYIYLKCLIPFFENRIKFKIWVILDIRKVTKGCRYIHLTFG